MAVYDDMLAFVEDITLHVDVAENPPPFLFGEIVDWFLATRRLVYNDCGGPSTGEFLDHLIVPCGVLPNHLDGT
jgi:hypothetical protein